MADPTPVNPMDFFRDMLGQWEKATNEMGNKVMSTPQFAQLMGQGTAMGAQVQQAVNEAMARTLATANMPSKADIDALGARIGAMEKQLARIEAALAPAVAPPVQRVPRTRKPPAKSA